MDNAAHGAKLDGTATALDAVADRRPRDCSTAAPRPAASAWPARVKRVLKMSHFVVAGVRAAKGLLHDLRVVAWVARRPAAVRRYVASHPGVRALHIGASNSILPGWLNTDLYVTDPALIYLDATRRFPFADGTFDYVMAEHMIEHIDYESAQTMLRECLRVLKPGGRIRLATPDLRMLIELYTSAEKTPMQRRYVDWMVQLVLPGVDHCHDVFVLNTAMREWGHQFLYDSRTLSAALQRVGFDEMQMFKPGVSGDRHLANLEMHGKEINAEDVNQFETLVIEARKPATEARSA